MGAIVALYFSLAIRPQPPTVQLAIQSALFGMSVGITFAAIFGVGARHDPAAAELHIFKKSPATGFVAAIGSLVGCCAFQFTDARTPWYLFDFAGLDRSRALIAGHPAAMVCALALAWALGKSIPPPAFLAVMSLKTIPLIDFMRGAAPQHDEAFANTLPPREHGELHVKAAIWWTHRGEAPRARYEWSEARRLGGLSSWDYAMCAAFYMATEDYPECETVLREGLAIYRNDPDLRYHLTTALEKQELLAEAEQEYRRIIDIQSDHAPSLHALANVLAGQQRLDEALDLYDRAVSSPAAASEDMPRYLNSRGAVLATQGAYQRAEADFRRAIQLGQEIYRRSGKTVDGVRDAVGNLGMLHGMRRRLNRPGPRSNDE
jgi:tetratricopeptide (TPR) repeat protein